MLRWFYNHHIGDVYVRCYDGKVRKCGIFGGNALCVFVHRYKDGDTGKRMVRMLNFYNDEQHIKNILKENKRLEPVDDITSIRLNMYHKEAQVLSKYFCKWYKVTLFYEEPKRK